MSSLPKTETDLLKDLPFELSQEEGLELFLHMERANFQNDPKSTLPAFQALAYIAAYNWSLPEDQQPNTWEVPHWVGEVLAEGFFRYQENQVIGISTTLGEAFQLEGHGQGKIPKIKKSNQLRSERTDALWIAWQKAKNNMPITRAIEFLAEHHDVSTDTVRKRWIKHRRDAIQVAANLLNR